MGSSPCRIFSLLGIAHPIMEKIMFSGAGHTPKGGDISSLVRKRLDLAYSLVL